MRAVILVGLVIIFISTAFILLTFTTMVKSNINCVGNPENPNVMKCNIGDYGVGFIAGLILVGFLMLLEIGAVYLMFT